MKQLNVSFIVLFLAIALQGCANKVESGATSTAPQTSARSIFQGSEATGENLQALEPVLGLLSTMPEGQASCSSVHIGNGYILTALHCVESHETHQSVTTLNVLSPVKGHLYDLGEQFQYSKAPGGEDLAVVVPNAKARPILAKISSVRLPSETTLDENSRALIAGYGMHHFEAEGDMKLRFGLANVLQMDGTNYMLGFEEGGRMSAALPGDSGGPLFVRNSSTGVLTVHGIASLLGYEKAHFFQRILLGQGYKGGNLYTRIDRPEILRWISQVTRSQDL